MANWYVDSVGYTAVAVFAVNHAYSVGDLLRQLTTPAVNNERVYCCTTAGTSAATEPTWAVTKGSTTTSGGAVFTEVTGNEAYQASGAWGAPHARLYTANAWAAAGDVIYVGSDHAETQASTLTLNINGTTAAPKYLLCVDPTGSVPPVSADVRTTATITTIGSSDNSIYGYFFCYGLNFYAGTGSLSNAMHVCVNTSAATFKNCSFNIVSTGATGWIYIGYSSNGIYQRPVDVVLEDCTCSFAEVGQTIALAGGRFLWRGGSCSGVIAPTVLFKISGNGGAGSILIEGVDLSLLGSGKTLVGTNTGQREFIFKDCKLGSGVTIASTPTTIQYAETILINCDSGATNYRHGKYQYMGTLTTSTAIIRTGGASDGTTGVSWKLATTANSKWVVPFEALPIAEWNTTTAANVTVTIEGVFDAAALPNNDDFWIDVEYLGASSSPLGSFKSGTKADYLATGAALTASTEAWDSQTTARANTTAYVVGDIIKVASNAGRIFFCTTAGTSAGSEPAGYASAVDGGSVTDNTATFRAGMRFKQTVTLSSPQPAQIGVIYAYPKAAKASSTFFIDPKITLA